VFRFWLGSRGPGRTWSCATLLPVALNEHAGNWHGPGEFRNAVLMPESTVQEASLKVDGKQAGATRGAEDQV